MACLAPIHNFKVPEKSNSALDLAVLEATSSGEGCIAA